MVERWKPLPASAYKEDFRLRKQVLPPTYKSTPVRAAHHVRKPLPRSRAKFTNVEKILWPAERYTKADVITYYDAVRDVILPHLRSRPIIMERYPNGIAEEHWQQNWDSSDSVRASGNAGNQAWDGWQRIVSADAAETPARRDCRRIAIYLRSRVRSA